MGNLQLRKASVSRICWPLNLAGEAQVASGREVLASSHLERQRFDGVGKEVWGAGGRDSEPWARADLARGQSGTVIFISQAGKLPGSHTYYIADLGHMPRLSQCRDAVSSLHHRRAGSRDDKGGALTSEVPEVGRYTSRGCW